MNIFSSLSPEIAGNQLLRQPQSDGYSAIAQHYSQPEAEREVGVVLPVGCGKSGLIAIAPFAANARRALVVAPNLRIAEQLLADFDPASERFFYRRCQVLAGSVLPEPAEIRGGKTNFSDLAQADVVITNIQQIQGDQNKWLRELSADFFDLILVDEGHHNVAESWDVIRRAFPQARIINFSATPARADGQRMAGRIVYSYSVFDAVNAGFIKSLKAVSLNPSSLRYVRRQDGEEVEVSLDEVRRLGEVDADFRRSIVSSQESLATIVSCAIRELRRLRNETGDPRHKIIASALNQQHCIQIVKEFQDQGLKRTAYVHSNEDSKANEKILKALESHELDAIVQVRKLGEGYDHPYLSVAVICSIFSNLSPFVQFVGRVMRAIIPNAPGHPMNQGVVIYHAGSNVARVWSDFQAYSQKDQKYFNQLLMPVEDLNFSEASEILIDPTPRNRSYPLIDVLSQDRIELEEIPLLPDAEWEALREEMEQKGVTPNDVRRRILEPIPATRQRQRQSSQSALDAEIKNAVGRLLARHGANPRAKNLAPPRENFVVLKSEIDKRVNRLAGRKEGERQEFSQDELNLVRSRLVGIESEVEDKFFALEPSNA